MTMKYFDDVDRAAIAAIRETLAECIRHQDDSGLDIRFTLKAMLQNADKKFADFQHVGKFNAPNDAGGTVAAITPTK